MELQRCVTHHILPVEHLQDVAKQLAASLWLLPLLQVELQLVRHQRQEDLAAICGDIGRYINIHDRRSTRGTDDRPRQPLQHMLSTHCGCRGTQLVNGSLTAPRIKLKLCAL